MSNLVYQFHIDNRPAGPIREEWNDAASDAVESGYGIWDEKSSVILDTNQGASIERFSLTKQ